MTRKQIKPAAGLLHGLDWAMKMTLVGMVLALGAETAQGGSITLQAQSKQTIQHAWAIARVQSDKGVYAKETAGKISSNGDITFSDLPPGNYDLKFQTEAGTIEGWDATVPPSEYEVEQPLHQAARNILLVKLQARDASDFDDDVILLDMQGNIQNAAVLIRHLRTRPFAGGGYKKGEMVYRVSRGQWETPDEITWVPYQERPSYALVRQRLFTKAYNALNTTYARHLGGLKLEKAGSALKLGKVLIPPAGPGIRAVNADGSTVAPLVIKSPSDDKPRSSVSETTPSTEGP